MINYFKKNSPVFYFLIIFLILLSKTDAVYPTGRTNDNDFKWRTISFPFDDIITQAVIFDSLNGWMFNSAERHLYRYQNGNWFKVPKANRFEYIKLFGYSSNNIWFCCFDEENYRYFLRHYNGKKWENIYTPNSDRINGLCYIAPDNIWGACGWGEIIHFDGRNWELIFSPVYNHFNCVIMMNDSLGWIGGEKFGKGILLQWDGTEWSQKSDINCVEIQYGTMATANIGYIFLNNQDYIIKLNNDKCEQRPIALQVDDTISVNFKNETKPIYFHTKKPTIFYTNFYFTFGDEEQEILYNCTDKNNRAIYLIENDGSTKLLKQKSTKFNLLSNNNFYKQTTDGKNIYGVSFVDINNDMGEEIYIINTMNVNQLLTLSSHKYESYIFVNVADKYNILGNIRKKDGVPHFDMGVTAADIENDGDKDIFITCLNGPNQLYENLKNKNFKEMGLQAGITCVRARSNGGIWGDVDNDGDLDLFVTNEDTTNMLFLNNSAGVFKDITKLSGLTSKRSGKGATFGDIDLDGDLDLIVPYFSLPNQVYRNEGIAPITGFPIFKNMTDQLLAPGPDSLAKSTSACLADIDNDGDLDLYITNLVFTNRLYQNDGMGYFEDITISAGVLDSSLSNSCCFFDADNDGDLDLFVTNRGRNLFFKNLGDKTFIRDTKTFKNNDIAYSTGFAYGDPDNDGDLDCYLANDDQPSYFYGNSQDNTNFLKLKIVGTKSNRDGIGAKVFLYEAGFLNEKKNLLGLREVNGGSGYGCMNSTVIHYGVQINKKYDATISFPSGIIITKREMEPGRLYIIEEQVGWEKFVSLSKRTILRVIKNRHNQGEFFFLCLNLIAIIVISRIIILKKWLNVSYQKYLIIIPLSFYTILSIILYDRELLLDVVTPVVVTIFSYAIVFILLKQHTASVEKERIAEELLTVSKAFDHGSWASSYLNRLQLFAMNLPNKKTISGKIEHQLMETIAGFYEQVYEAIKKISELAMEAAIEPRHAAELGRQLLFLSDNLNKIKVNLSIKKEIPTGIWNHIFRLIDGIKINIKAIKFEVFRYFTSDANLILERVITRFKEKANYPVTLISATENKSLVSIKPSDLSAIFDNLLSNANRALVNSVNKSMEIKTRTTDQYFIIECSDTGTGIPKNLWEKIFDMNYSTKSGKTKGGFGLYYSRSVLEKYGGSIEVLKSGKNKGTTFLVKLRML